MYVAWGPSPILVRLGDLLEAPAAAVDEDPSGVSCQPPGATCGKHVPGPRRGGPSVYPGGRVT